MTDKLRQAAILPFLLAASSAPAPASAWVRGVTPRETSAEHVELAPSAEAELPHFAAPPQQVGGYRVLRELGAGGMGTVYLAESTGIVPRRVALKLVNAGASAAALRAQFEVEQRALASIEHEHVARFYDAGSTDDGRPWLAMEFVDGQTLLEFCDTRELDVDARLELFSEVCNAVQHLHDAGVLHGDLKPENILVVERDGRAVPKLIDLGLARVRGWASAETDVIMGTPEFMAPEQFSVAPSRLDARADVYALGTVLRRLLVGSADAPKPRSGWIADVLERMRGATPTPSESLAALDAQAALEVSRRRGTRAARLRRRLQRSLDGIVGRATRVNAQERYDSAGALAGALRSELDQQRAREQRLRTGLLVAVTAAVGFACGWMC